MKNEIFSVTSIILILISSCQKNIERQIYIEDKVLNINSLTYSDCKQNSSSSEITEYLEYNTVDSNYLFVKHLNASLNCCPDSIKVNSFIADGEIYYSVCQKAPNCNCNCLYDISCVIGPLVYAKYQMRINVCTGTNADFTLDFNSKTNNKIIFKNL